MLLYKELGAHQLGMFIFNISYRLSELKPYTWFWMLNKDSLILQLFGKKNCTNELAWNIFIM
jgi:hypothetical protein